MKKLTTLFALVLLVQLLGAQNYVSTTAENKKVILEEFTGTGCPNCPGGHTMAANLLTANPGNVFVIAFHPTNSSYTATDPMKNAFGNAFYTNPFISPTNRYMPSAMISRRVWGGVERIQGVNYWTNDVNTIKSEASPLNVGLASTYDAGTKMLSVTVEVYFTSDVTDALTLYTVLTQDGIIATQSGATGAYTHNHVFRAAIGSATPEQWGEPMAGASVTGSLQTVTYTYDNNTTNFDMTKCELVVYVRNAANEEIISGNGAAVGMTTSSQSLPAITENVTVYPNPVSENTSLQFSLTKPAAVTYQIVDMLGHVIAREDLGTLVAGNHQIEMNTAALEAGVYFINLNDGAKTSTVRIIK